MYNDLVTKQNEFFKIVNPLREEAAKGNSSKKYLLK